MYFPPIPNPQKLFYSIKKQREFFMAVNYKNGFLAGLIATVVLSIILLIIDNAGVKSDLVMVHKLGYQLTDVGDLGFFGWVIHLLIGTFIWGGLFVWLAP